MWFFVAAIVMLFLSLCRSRLGGPQFKDAGINNFC
jgi:hypothetical protein